MGFWKFCSINIYKNVQLLNIAVRVIKIVFISFSLTGIFYTIMILLEVTGYEMQAVAMILTRQVLLMDILPLILPDLSIAIF